MYGLLLDSIQKFITENYGQRCWEAVRARAGLTNRWFVTHEVYSDQVMLDLVNAVASELGKEPAVIMRLFGEFFVQSVGQYGYARLLRVLGRDMRDFLNGLDDLHEYLRFSYPKMKAPSFYCEQETEEGMLLHYTTSRKGFIEYVVGQLVRVGIIYGKHLEVVQRSMDERKGELHYVLELRFDNRELLALQQRLPSQLVGLTIDFETFLQVFPFSFVFDSNLVIRWVGDKLSAVLPGLTETNLATVFTLKKPQFCTLSWDQMQAHCNCVFELVSKSPVTRDYFPDSIDLEPSNPPLLKLKGEMLLLKEKQSIAFLCSPVLDSPEDLYQSGVFINDLSKHDTSRDYILAGSRQHPELNLALDQERIRSAQLEESSRRTDELLYQMIPKPIADQLRNGETPLNTCREFDNVSVLFSDIVSFTPMCSRLRPMEVVCVLNAMCVAFDKLCEQHGVYKVEMIGDGYMVICGAPDAQPRHAEHITDFALSIINATSKINDPSTNQSLKIRVGVHSGPIVGGVVGTSILRYDVFGDTVNVAARMEATGEPMKIHISEATAKLLKDSPFTVEYRGKVQVKGKGLMTTYWVQGKREGATSLIVRATPQYFKQPLSPHRLSPEHWPNHFSQRRSTSPAVLCPMQLSELNLLSLSESVTPAPSVCGTELLVGGGVPSVKSDVNDLRRFAELAEANACQARAVADMAAKMLGQSTSPQETTQTECILV